MEELKYCTKCEEMKPLSEFHNDKGKKDGKYTICIECVRTRKEELNEFNDDNEPAKIPNQPGVYSSEKYKKSTFTFLKECGWIHNQKKDIWYKTPLKDENGRWLLPKPVIQPTKYIEKPKVIHEHNIIKKRKQKLAVKPEDYVPTNYKRPGALPLETMEQIRLEYQGKNMTQEKLSKKYHISISYVNNILNYKR